MNSQEFTEKLKAELEKHSAIVINRWKKVLSILPEETKAVSVIISPSQDGDGIFDIFVSLDGSALYVLNKKYVSIISCSHQYTQKMVLSHIFQMWTLLMLSSRLTTL